MSMLLASQVFHLELDKTTAFVLMAICDVADDDGTGCIGSDDYIMWKTGVSRATFYRTLSKLEKLQVIKRVPLADGRIETLVALARAPRKIPWKLVRAQLLQSQNETVKSVSLKMRLGESQNETGTRKMKVPSDQAVSGAAAQSPTNVIHPSYPSSLLRQAQAPAREGESQATLHTPEARAESTRSKADPRRAALTAALAKYPQYFGQPRSANEWKNWNARLTSLLSGGLAPTDVPRAVNAWKRKYPNAQLTINALDLHLGELLPATVSAPPTPAAEPEIDPPTLQQEETPRHVELHTSRFPLAEDNGPAPEQIDWAERHRLASERARAALAAANARATATPLVSARHRLSAASRAPGQVS